LAQAGAILAESDPAEAAELWDGAYMVRDWRDWHESASNQRRVN